MSRETEAAEEYYKSLCFNSVYMNVPRLIKNAYISGRKDTMDKAKVIKIFALVFLLAFIGIMTWDVFLYSDAVEGNSITQSIIFYSHQYPIIACAFGYFTGFLTAHFWG